MGSKHASEVSSSVCKLKESSKELRRLLESRKVNKKKLTKKNCFYKAHHLEHVICSDNQDPMLSAKVFRSSRFLYLTFATCPIADFSLIFCPDIPHQAC